MTRNQALKLLRGGEEGVAEWNRRRQEGEEIPSLSEANLSWANLSGTDLSEANLSKANLRWANLSKADLRKAFLRWANLHGANLSEANLHGANLPHFQLPDGDLVMWGKKRGHIVKLRVPPEAKRTASLVGRKCRAEWVEVLLVEGAEEVTSDPPVGQGVTYRAGEIVRPDSYGDDPRVECAHGIHCFATRAEAEEWNP